MTLAEVVVAMFMLATSGAALMWGVSSTLAQFQHSQIMMATEQCLNDAAENAVAGRTIATVGNGNGKTCTIALVHTADAKDTQWVTLVAQLGGYQQELVLQQPEVSNVR